MCCIVPNKIYLCVIKVTKKLKSIVMKASSTKFAPIEPSTLKGLTEVVKETLAPASMLGQHKIFSAADLWNIQRQARQRVQRRFI